MSWFSIEDVNIFGVYFLQATGLSEGRTEPEFRSNRVQGSAGWLMVPRKLWVSKTFDLISKFRKPLE